MRTTVNLDPDVERAVERLRREEGLGVSEAVNELARRGLLGAREAPRRFVQKASPMGARLDLRNVAEAIEALDGAAAP